jgi:anthranilate phosphoribosyltransferase
MKEILQKLMADIPLTREDAHAALSTIMAGEATDAQIACFLTALRLRGETPEVVAGAADAMREAFTPVASVDPGAVDTCGTGGDGLQTFNISTTAAFVTAGAGVHVAKHGNRGVSSRSGSADVLRELGVNLDIGPDQMAACLKEVGIAFLFAPALHPAMKHAIGPRREMGISTLFNILGPLSNPASTRRGVLGVFSPELVELVSEALAALKAEHMFVVHGEDGLDELSITGPSLVAEVANGTVTRSAVHPEQFGLPLASLNDIRGGDPAENAEMTRSILKGETGAKRDIVVLNAGAAICAGGKAKTIGEGVEKAQASLDSGAALAKLEGLIQQSNREG